MPTTHAKLSASGAHRWLNCPGSIKLSEHFPSTSSVYAEEGTLAHELAEQMITGRAKASTKRQVDAWYAEHGIDGSAKEMIETLEPYRDYVKSEHAAKRKADPGAQLMTEQKVDLSEWIPGGFGTTDVAIIGGGELHIIDLKFGKGVAVSAEGNPQLRLYALGTLSMLEMLYDIDTVRMTIYQPRLDSVSTDKIGADDLRAWGDEVIKPAAQMALSDDAPTAAGDWCRFCPAKATCRTRADKYLGLREYLAQMLLSPEEIGRVLGDIDGLVRWADKLKAFALSQALQGDAIPGWKVVEGRSVRKYSRDEATIVAACEAAGYAEPLLYERRLLGITAMEKLMGKKAFADILGSFVEKPQGKPTLVPESDKRPALTGITSADDFAD